MTTTQDAGVTVTPATLPAGTPGRTAPVLFGFAGAWWASSKAKKLGVTNTKHYWIIGAISTGVSMLLGLLIPVLIFMILASSIGGGSTFNNPSAVSPLGNSADAPVVAAGPIQPVASSPEDTIRAIEDYRIQAFATGNPALLANYISLAAGSYNKELYDYTVNQVNLMMSEHLLGHVSMTITKIKIFSVTPTEMIADVSVYDTVDKRVLDDRTYKARVYRVENGRWLMVEQSTMP